MPLPSVTPLGAARVLRVPLADRVTFRFVTALPNASRAIAVICASAMSSAVSDGGLTCTLDIVEFAEAATNSTFVALVLPLSVKPMAWLPAAVACSVL